jgi:hypothetical protein
MTDQKTNKILLEAILAGIHKKQLKKEHEKCKRKRNDDDETTEQTSDYTREVKSQVEETHQDYNNHPCTVAAKKTRFVRFCASGNLQEIEKLYRDVTAETREAGYSAACRGNQPHVVRFFLWETDVFHWFGIHFPYACKRGRVEMVKVMLEFAEEEYTNCDLGLQEVCCEQTLPHFEIVALLKEKKPQGLDFARGYQTALEYKKRLMADCMVKNGALEILNRSFRRGDVARVQKTWNYVKQSGWSDHKNWFLKAIPIEAMEESGEKEEEEEEEDDEEVVSGLSDQTKDSTEDPTKDPTAKKILTVF